MYPSLMSKSNFEPFDIFYPFQLQKFTFLRKKIVPLKRLHTFLEDPDEKDCIVMPLLLNTTTAVQQI